MSRTWVSTATIAIDIATAGQIKANLIATLPDGSGVNTINVETFTASDTYIPTAGMVYCIIEAQAPGGGGGGADSNSTTVVVGGGGGGGEYARGLFMAVDIGASKAVNIGAVGAAGSLAGGNGGNAVGCGVGSLITAFGGNGGVGTGGNSVDQTARAGGAGGTGGAGGFLRTPGAAGDSSLPATVTTRSGAGGHSRLGFGGASVISNYAAGIAGANYGGGGSGATTNIATPGNVGGAGGPGIIIITEFIIA